MHPPFPSERSAKGVDMKDPRSSTTSKSPDGAAAQRPAPVTSCKRVFRGMRRGTAGMPLLLAYLSLPPLALAGGVVGDGGTSASCTDAALGAAVAGGGAVTFNCGSDPATIAVTSSLQITTDTSIDGGGLVALRAVRISGLVLAAR